MMVEAESTPETLKLIANPDSGAVAPTEETVAEGLEAAKPFIRVLCEAQQQLAAEAAKPTAEYPVFLDYGEDVYEAVVGEVSAELAQALTIAPKQEREAETDRLKALAQEKLAERFEGRRERDQRLVPVADQEAGPGAGHQGRDPHRRPWPDGHPAAVCPDARAAPGARVRAVRAG